MGDFTGFSFGGKTSEELGIVRVSGGDRYEEEIHPEIKDITAEVPGINGDYYFGSNYGPKEISIEIAFDSLTEKQFRELRAVFSTKKIKELIFDEWPYKKYMAKIANPIQLSYVCFDEPKRVEGTAQNGVRRDRENDQEYEPGGDATDTLTIPAGESCSFTLTHVPNGEVTIAPSEVSSGYNSATNTFAYTNEGEEPLSIEISYSYDATPYEAAWEQVTPWVYQEGTQRVYKGEGQISFICYFPFAKSVYKELPVDEVNSDWAEASRLLTSAQYTGIIDTYSDGKIKTYNAGDLPTGFRLYLPSAVVQSATTIDYYEEGGTNQSISPTASLVLSAMTMQKNGESDGQDILDVGVIVDTNNELIIGIKTLATDMSGNVIYTTSGNIYNKYVTSGYFFHLEPNASTENFSIIEFTGGGDNIKIFYDYLYF